MTLIEFRTDAEKGLVEILNHLEGTIAAVDTNAPDFFGQLDRLTDSTLPFHSPVKSNAVSDWIKNNWLQSLTYFLSTLSFRHDDAGDERRSIGQMAVEEYGEAPTVNRTRDHSKDSYVLGEGIIPRVSVEDALRARRTRRLFKYRKLDYEIFSSILRTGLGPVMSTALHRIQSPHSYPILSYGGAFSYYLAVYSVATIEPGLYWLSPSDGTLCLVSKGDLRQEVYCMLSKQHAPLTGSATLMLVADFVYYQHYYRHERALRNLFIEAGRIVHRCIIEAERHECGAFVTPAVIDSLAEKLLGLDFKREQLLYTMTFGLKNSQSA